MRKNFIGILVLSLLVLGLNGIGNANLNDGLVAYYPFNGNANDESGNGNNGITHGNVVYSAIDRKGKANGAIYIGDSQSYIEIDHSGTLELQAHTISAWVKRELGHDTAGNGGVFTNGYSFESYGLVASETSVQSWINYPNPPNQGSLAFDTNILKDQKYHHIVSTFDGNRRKLWVDGIMYAELYFPVTIDYSKSENSYIGMDFPGGDDWFSGTIDDVLIYNRAIYESEIQELYVGYVPQTCYEAGYLAGVAAGQAACKANPASCGINVNGGDAVTLTSDLKMHLPNIEYNVPFIGIMSMWADLVYDPTKTDAAYFKVTGAGAN